MARQMKSTLARHHVSLLLVTFALSCASLPTAIAPTPSERPQVVVVGGGLAGLVGAYELEKQGVSVHLLELSHRLGGRVGTAHYNNELFAEYGLKEIWTGNPLSKLAQDLGLPRKSAVGVSSVLLDGRIHAFPQSNPDEYMRELFTLEEYRAQQAWMQKAGALLNELQSSGLTSQLVSLQSISFFDWLRQEGLPPRVIEWILLTLECEIGESAENFSALFGLAELRMFLRGEEALSIVGGNGRLVDALSGAIHGPKTLLARVTRVEQVSSGVRVTYLKNDHLHTLDADRALVTIPWTALHRVEFIPPLPDDAWRAISSMGRGEYTQVHFIIDKAAHALWKIPTSNLFPILTRGPLGVIYGVDHPSPLSQPYDVFGLLLFGPHLRTMREVPPDEQRRTLLAELEKLWPGFSLHVRDFAIYPNPNGAIPSWPPGRSPFDALSRNLLNPHNGIYLAGDYLLSSHSDGAVVSAQQQAKAIAASLAHTQAKDTAILRQ